MLVVVEGEEIDLVFNFKYLTDYKTGLHIPLPLNCVVEVAEVDFLMGASIALSINMVSF